MKNRIFRFAFVVVLVGAGLSLRAANTSRTDNEYKITPVQQTELTDGIDKAWTLAYGPGESPITISFKSGKHCKTYIVRGAHFEVVYECTRKGFGARLPRSSESILPESLNSRVVNDTELGKQRILTSDPVDDDRALSLIAAYLPDLVNPSYQYLLN